jgi:predicted DNA-binding transcriptional regulator YafY
VNRIESRSPATLPPVTLTPEEAAAVALALAAQPDGPYARAGAAALVKVLQALEPDPRQRAQLLEAVERVGSGATSRHPAGRRRPAPAEPQRPRLSVLPGGRS